MDWAFTIQLVWLIILAGICIRLKERLALVAVIVLAVVLFIIRGVMHP